MAKNDNAQGDNASNASKDARRAADAARAKAADALHEFKLAGNQLVDKVRELIEEGNVRRIIVKKDERILFELPLTVGVGAGAAAVLISPILAALGAVAALVTDVTLVVEREDDAAAGTDAKDAPKKGGADKTVGRGTGDEG